MPNGGDVAINAGNGISRENMWRIFDPFFSIKESGREAIFRVCLPGFMANNSASINTGAPTSLGNAITLATASLSPQKLHYILVVED